MDFYCDRCGYHARFGLGQAPHNALCQVCGVGRMRQGVMPYGFRIEQNACRPFVPQGQSLMLPYAPVISNGEQHISHLDYFSLESGDKYKKVIQEETVYLGRFNKILLPDLRRFSWLVPYTGNKHNQRYFTQALLAKVAAAQFRANGGVFPRFIEPFVGSGQIFLNACHWGPSFNQGIPLFHEFIGGDLNPYVVAAFTILRNNGPAFVNQYASWAAALDENPDTAFQQRLTYLNAHGYLAATGKGPSSQHGIADFAVMSYIYVVNRCVHGSKLNANMGLTAGRNEKCNLAEVRKREIVTLTNICQTLQTIGTTQFICQDFADTCKLAKPTDIVIMDCPFPNFTKALPKNTTNPESESTAAGTYGVGDDGASLQGNIVKITSQLLAQGTTVVLCNFANVGLIRAYTNLLWKDTGIPNECRRWFTFTYCSPARNSEAYLLTILPGRGKIYVNDVPAQIRSLWSDCGGDDNFGTKNQQQFFTSIGVAPVVEELVEDDWDDLTIEIKPDSTSTANVSGNNNAADDDSSESMDVEKVG